MRVLLVGKAAPERGGIAAVIGDLVDGPLAELVEVRLHNLTRVGAPPRGGALTAGNVRRTLADVVAVHRAARSVDVVHLHSALAPAVTLVRAGVLVLAARLAGRPVVVHAHGGRAIAWLGHPAARLLARFALAGAARVVAVAEPVREAFAAALGGRRVTCVPNGVDLDRYAPRVPAGGPDAVGHRDAADGGPPTVLYVGLLTPRKGVIDLLEASERLQADHPHRLLLVGGTPDEGADAAVPVLHRAAAAGAELRGAVPREAMPDVYAEADLFCLPSWWEAMPMTVLEAMASGLPVVATRVGAVPELLGDDAGALVAPQDPAELAAALAPFLDDPGRRGRAGAAARARAAGFDRRTTAARLVEVYRQAAA